MHITKTGKLSPPGHQSRSLSGGFHCKEAPSHQWSGCDQRSNQPGFMYLVFANVDGNTAKYTFSVGVVTYLWYVFGGDLKVQFAIDVDFPGVSTIIMIFSNLADLSASLLGK